MSQGGVFGNVRLYCTNVLTGTLHPGSFILTTMSGFINHIPDDTKKLQRPCNECPYSKTVTPGALGGSDPSVYVGQGHGPFWLPCHKNVDFKDPNWKQDTEVQQCAGAAIYRANVGRDIVMPGSLHKLPADESVFQSPAELLAHHRGITLGEADQYLIENSPENLMIRELKIASNL